MERSHEARSASVQKKDAPEIDEHSGPALVAQPGVGVGDIQALMASGGNLGMVQLSGGGAGTEAVHAAAAHGVSGSGGALPHQDSIQQAFGRHDVSNVQAHTGAAAKQATASIGAEAYATGNDIAFGGAPSLHTAAHEAAHVVQQRAGVSLSGGVGKSGDAYENHADAVADLVVQGKSAEGALDKMAGGGGGGSGVQSKAVQRVTPPTTGPAPGATPAGATPAAPVPLDRAQTKAKIDAKAGYSDLSDAYAQEVSGKLETELDTELSDQLVVRNKVISAFVKSGDAKTNTQLVGKDDPIAVQKFQDIDQEAHLTDSGLKGTFYGRLATEMQKDTFTDRSRTFTAMQACNGDHAFSGKGKPIAADRVTQYATRNHSITSFMGALKASGKGWISRKISMPLREAGVPETEIQDKMQDERLRVKAFASILKDGTDPLSLLSGSGNVTDYGTWYHPGSLATSVPSDPDLAFADMMTLGALQPEWYPRGTMVLSIDHGAAASRVCLKPTAFDGLMSSLWVARNVGTDDYGLTGGGAGEFLEAAVPWSKVTNARAVIPSDELQAELQRLIAATPPGSTATEEAIRGGTAASGGPAEQVYGQVIRSTNAEQKTPSASPTLPGASSPSGTSANGPAVARGGAYDR